MQPEGLIGKPDSKTKEVVIISKKQVEESANDIATQQKKVIMKDLLAVLKSDSRLAHKPLVYQLQNRVQWPTHTQTFVKKNTIHISQQQIKTL